MSDRTDPTAPVRHRPPLLLRFALSLALFLMVLGANWAVVDRFGSELPDMDQWDAEGVHLIVPWFEGGDFLAELFHPQNEHRVILTKLQNLALVLVGGQWDARVECLFNSVLHAFVAVGLWCVARRWTDRRWHAPLYLVIGALYALPLAWQNLLGGFHSQQYWLAGLSLAAIAVLPWACSWSRFWWMGAATAVLALGSMGSGFFAAAVVLGIVVGRLLLRETTLRQSWPTLVLTLVLVGVGVATRIEVDYHEGLKAKSAAEFGLYLLRSLAWPLRSPDWIGVFLWFPWLAVTAAALRRILMRSRASAGDRGVDSFVSRGELMIVALGGWVWLQLLATAYARGDGAHHPASRYMDTLMIGVAVNAIAIAWWYSRRPAVDHAARSATQRAATQLPLAAVFVAWAVLVGTGVFALTRDNLQHDLPSTKAYFVDAEAHVRGYLATDDPAELVDPIPYLDAPRLIERLSYRSVREHMPAVVRPALPLAPAAAEVQTRFHANWAPQRLIETAPREGLSPHTPPLAARPTWGSYAANGAGGLGEWRSGPLRTRRGWLAFETAGDLGAAKVTLELHDAATGAVLTEVRPTKVPHDSWRTAYVRAPDRPFVVVARDDDPGAWLAFSAPVELSSLSYWSWKLTKNGLLLAELAAVAAVLLGIGSVVAAHRVRPCQG